jgi:hypothetical protein
MPETPTVPTIQDTKPCKVCGEAIKKVARICTHCNNYQDWRAELNIGGTVLSLLVALFSVLTVALPAITAFLTPKNSDLIFSYQGTLGNTISLLITNIGIRPGAVHYLRVTSQDSPVIFPFTLLEINAKGSSMDNSDASESARIIEAGKSQLVNFYMLVNFVAAWKQMADNSSKQCTLNLTGTDFLGVTTNKQLMVGCKLLDQPFGPPPPVLPLPDQH